MAEERETDNARPDEDRAARRDRRGRKSLGRRIATVVVSLAILYLVGVGLASVIPQVFWPDRVALDPSLTCAEGLREMRAELLARSSDRVASLGAQEDLTPFFARWDERHVALEPRCSGSELDAWELLGRLRQRVDDTLERVDDEEGDLARRMDNTLARRDDRR